MFGYVLSLKLYLKKRLRPMLPFKISHTVVHRITHWIISSKKFQIQCTPVVRFLVKGYKISETSYKQIFVSYHTFFNRKNQTLNKNLQVYKHRAPKDNSNLQTHCHRIPANTAMSFVVHACSWTICVRDNRAHAGVLKESAIS